MDKASNIEPYPEDSLQMIRDTSPIPHTQSRLACGWVEWSSEHIYQIQISFVNI